MHLNVYIPTDEPHGEYLVRSARIRNLSVSRLVHKLIVQIGQDQLVRAVLDDDGQVHHDKYGHPFREVKVS